jgi:hypothetical protein
MIRFFETDGEITEGSKNIKKLYEMMRSTSAAAAAAAATTTRITFEDYVVGYGTDVDLGCLKQLASPFPPTPPAETVEGGRNPQRNPHCSSLVTIIKPEDIGWQVGDILFKIIMRYGFNVQVSIAAASDGATAELFEYQTHQWGAETTLHSLIHGEKRPLWIQYTPSPSLPSTDAATASPPPPVVSVKIQYANQFTGESYTYQFEHDIHPTAPESAREEQDDDSSDVAASPDTIRTIMPLILGMIQIENLKQFREIEAARYDKDTIVREAYKTLRMLNSIDEIVRAGFPVIACQTLNLMTDAKLIIGLTTIQNQKEQHIILHARRICSAEQEMFNTGATVSRRYVPGEENHEEDAIRVINAAKAAAAAANPDDAQQHPHPHPDQEEHEYAEEMNDALPSRIPTFMPRYNTQDDFMDTPFATDVCGGGPYNGNRRRNAIHCGSEVRALCVRIATARNNQEDTSAEELYQQMQAQNRYGGCGQYDLGEYDDDAHCYHGAADETFSSTPMDDDYTQRRMGMMRQMSS